MAASNGHDVMLGKAEEVHLLRLELDVDQPRNLAKRVMVESTSVFPRAPKLEGLP